MAPSARERRPPVGTARRRRAGDVNPPHPHDSQARGRRPPAGTARRRRAGDVNPPHPHKSQARERRPPVGTARRRRAGDVNPPHPHESQARERRPLVGTARRRRAGDVNPTRPHESQARERRPLASSPGGGRHSPPQAGGRHKPPAPSRVTGKGTPTSGRHRRAGRKPPTPSAGKGDLRSAPTPQGCEQRIVTRPHESQARERRPPAGTARRRRAGDVKANCCENASPTETQRPRGRPRFGCLHSPAARRSTQS